MYIIFSSTLLFNITNLLRKLPWLHRLHKENPSKYTQRGKLRHPTDGQFTPGTNLVHRDGLVPQKILYILIGTLLKDCGGELEKKGVTAIYHFKQGVVHTEYIYLFYFSFLRLY